MLVLILNMDSNMKTTPAQNTAPNATAQGTFIPFTMVNVKKALRPIPGATTIGFFAYNPIMVLLKKQTSTVAVSTAEKGIPAWLNIEGLTTIMYAVAMNEDVPAMISVVMEDLVCCEEGKAGILWSD